MSDHVDSRLATRPLPPGVTAVPIFGAALRADGTPRDRYLLTWTHRGRTGPLNLIAGMNPSGASASFADSTLIKVWGFTYRWNNGSFVMANVVPYRATSPREMRFDPFDLHDNLRHIIDAAQRVSLAGGHVVVAWGTPSLPREHRAMFDAWADNVYRALRSIDIQPLCLGVSKDGSPRHPLMLAYDTPLVPWRPR